MVRLVGAIFFSFVLLAAVLYVNHEHDETKSMDLAPTIVQLKNWHLKGSTARKDMERYFDKQNFKAEAKHFDHFVQSHPFFGEGGMYNLPEQIHLPNNLPFKVAGFPRTSEKQMYDGRKLVRKIVGVHPLHNEVKLVPRAVIVRRGQ